jgi:outer membrane lipopolysaccharide assembly protein LptE/RlpB
MTLESRVSNGGEVPGPKRQIPSKTGEHCAFLLRFGIQGSRFRSGFLCMLGAGCWVLLLACTACGYHTAGHTVQVPEGIQTIAIPAFNNESTTYQIQQILTESVVREFTTRTRYQILHEASGEADATLQGTVLSTAATPLAYDTNTGRAASVLVVVSVSVKLMDRHGKVLYQNPQYLFREQYELSQDLTTFFQEDSPALRRLSRDFGRTLVSNLLEGF